MIKLLKSISAVEAFWKALWAPPAEPLHPNMCASSTPPAPRAHTQLTEMLHPGCDLPANAPRLLLPKARAVFPQVCQPHRAVMKRQINYKYFILFSVHLRSHPFYKKAISLMFVAVSSLESYQTPARHHGCHHAIPAHPAIPREFLIRPHLSLMNANSFSFTHLLKVSH